jgi:competence protein ComEC
MLLPLPLFINKKEWALFFIAVLAIFFINLTLEYQDYKEFKSQKRVETKVLAYYPKINKNGKEYYVLKCKNDKVSFYTTTYKKFDNLINRYISIRAFNAKVEFLDYLSGFYMPSRDIKIVDIDDNYGRFYKSLIALHQDSKVQEFYSAIFIGSHISKDTRESIATLGISHLVAISGFHISILLIFIYGVLYFPYKFFQQRFFPYRNIKIDILSISIVILFFYLSFVDFIPSLLRSYAMLLIGTLFLVRYIKILSFATLLIAVVLIIALFPKMLFSIGFWFSVSGVFYIYLFLHYLHSINKYAQAIMFNFWIFMAMIPIAHYYFGIFSIYQIFSPMLSLVFVIFYPISLILHTIGISFVDIFDSSLSTLLSIKDTHVDIKTPLWFLVSYILLSIASIYSKRVFILLNIVMVSFLGYCIYIYYL